MKDQFLKPGAGLLATLLAAALATGQLPFGKAVPDGEWKPVAGRSLEIVAGSPLDFSEMVPVNQGAPLTVSGD